MHVFTGFKMVNYFETYLVAYYVYTLILKTFEYFENLVFVIM